MEMSGNRDGDAISLHHTRMGSERQAAEPMPA